MTTKRVTMIKLKEILRLKYEAQLSLRQIALCLSLSIGVISNFTVLFKRWRNKQSLSMRQQHRVGEKLFVDYCGPTCRARCPAFPTPPCL